MSPPGRPLLEAFGVGAGSVVALAGGGGKTTLMYLAAATLAGSGLRVLSTTTTRIHPPASSESPSLVLLDAAGDAPSAMARGLDAHGHVTVAQHARPDGKLGGVAPETVDAWSVARVADAVIVEADGSAGRPLKAARDGEPVIPATSTDVVLVVGADAFGAPLDERIVFRSALAVDVAGVPRGAPVTPEVVAALLLGPRGAARVAPPGARLAVFVNKVEDDAHARAAAALADLALGDPRVARVVVGSLRRVAAGFLVYPRRDR